MDSDSQLRQLDFQGVAFTASVSPDGELGKVGIWDKLGKDTMDLARRGLLHTVVVAGEQDDVPQEYLGQDGPIHVIKAETVDDAISQLYDHSLSRRAVQHYERDLCKDLDVWGNGVAFDEPLYQQLPLLQKIEPKQLTPPPGAAELEHDPRLDQPTERQVNLESWLAGCAGIPRLVVTGDPGSGKSTLAQYLAWRVATNELQPGGRILLPLRVSLKDWAAGRIDSPLPTLPEYLAQCYHECPNAPTKDEFNRWLHKGNVLLLLDGLDEAQGDKFSKALNRALTQYDGCPTILTCRTLHYEQYQRVTSGYDVFKLTPLSTDQQDHYIHAYAAAFGGLPADALIDRLNKPNNKMRLLTGSPLLLSAICYVLADAHADDLTETRGELFARLVTKLLTRQRRDISYPGTGTAPDLDTKRKVLEQVALHGFLRVEGRFSFKSRWISDRIKDTLKASGYDTDLAQWSSALCKDLVNGGLLNGKADTDYHFLHTAIQEFLAAGALARIINEPSRGWDACLEIAGYSYSITEIIDHKAWDPAWHEVVLLLAGQLKAPTPLLKMLSKKEPTKTNPHGDDYFRHRLALAAECLPQIHEQSRPVALTSRITSQAYSVWWKYARHGTANTMSPLTTALRALAAGEFHFDGYMILDYIVALMSNKHPSTRAGAAYAIGQLGAIVASENILNRLINLIQDNDSEVQGAAASAIAHVNTTATSNKVMQSLVRIMQNDDMRSIAAHAIRMISATAATSTSTNFLDRLIGWLRSDNRQFRILAAEIIPTLGVIATQCEELMEEMAALLDDHDTSIRVCAANAFVHMNCERVAHVTMSRVINLINDEDSRVRTFAARMIALGNSNSVLDARKQEIIDTMADDVSIWVRAYGTYLTLRRNGMNTSQRLKNILTDTMKDKVAHIRFVEIIAIRESNEKEASGYALSVLPSIVNNGVFFDKSFIPTNIRWIYCTARRMSNAIAGAMIYRVHPTSTMPVLLKKEFYKLQSMCHHFELRRQALYAIGQFKNSATNDGVLSSLSSLLRYHPWIVWFFRHAFGLKIGQSSLEFGKPVGFATWETSSHTARNFKVWSLLTLTLFVLLPCILGVVFIHPTGWPIVALMVVLVSIIYGHIIVLTFNPLLVVAIQVLAKCGDRVDRNDIVFKLMTILQQCISPRSVELGRLVSSTLGKILAKQRVFSHRFGLGWSKKSISELAALRAHAVKPIGVNETAIY